MSSLFSTSWYRVAALRPKLRAHVEVHRQPYRGEASFVLQDLGNGKMYRFNAAAYELIGRMNGERTVDAIWQAMVETRGDDAPTQDDVIDVLGRLHAADALQGSFTPDCLELFRRAERERNRRWKKMLRSPMSLRVPLIDPDRLLVRLGPLVAPALTPVGLALWAIMVAAALVALTPHGDELWSYAREHALAPQNLVLLGCIYVVVKLLHELGHGLTTRHFGGEVHEAGITLLVLVPVPYVDASASTSFRRKRHRILVSAAGMMAELFVASIAAFVWVTVEPGLVRAAAFDVMLIAGVSTLVFNGNPLLRFDSYYILEDLVEIPGLATRSSRYLTYLLQRYLLGMEAATSPVTRAGERTWFVGYGIVSTVYRWILTVTIIWFVAGQYFVVGVVLALWAALSQILAPLGKALIFLVNDPRLARGRLRAVTTSAAAVAALAAALVLVPLPVATRADGVLLPPDDAHVEGHGTGRRPRGADAAVLACRRRSGAAQARLALRPLEAQRARGRARRDPRPARGGAGGGPGRGTRPRRGDRGEASRGRRGTGGPGRAGGAQPRGRTVHPAGPRRSGGQTIGDGELIGYVVTPDAPRVQVAVPQAPCRAHPRGSAFSGRAHGGSACPQLPRPHRATHARGAAGAAVTGARQ